MRLTFSTQAKQDLTDIAEYLACRSGSRAIAQNFTRKLLSKCREIANIPGKIGRHRPELHPHIRSYPYGNYIIFFIYHETCLEIVSVIEGHRDIETLFND